MTDRKLQFTRIKHDGQVVELDYLTEHGEDSAKTELSSESPPSPEFVATLHGLKRPMLKFLEMPTSYGENIEVRTVALKYAKGDFSSFVVTAIRPLKFSNGPLVLNTPNINIPEGDAPSCIDEMIGLIEDLILHAAAYEQGHRAQLDAFSTDDAAAPDQQQNGKQRGPRQEDIEEQLDQWELRRALDSILPHWQLPAGPIEDNQLAAWLLNAFDVIELVDPDSIDRQDQTWPGIFRHQLMQARGCRSAAVRVVRGPHGCRRACLLVRHRARAIPARRGGRCGYAARQAAVRYRARAARPAGVHGGREGRCSGGQGR